MKNIFIVGGSSGIGLALIKALHQDHKIYAASRQRGDIPESDNITWNSLDIMGEELDLSFLPDKIDGFVYCPGSINLKPFRGIKPDEAMKDYQINALGAMKTAQGVLSKLKKGDGASVVFFSTVAVAQGMPYHASISMAKGAVEGLTRSMAAELAPNIRVNAIAPSLTDTPLATRLLSNEERKEASAQRHPLKRVGKPEDIAEMAAFLLSDKASWITGQVLHVDGGIGQLKI